MEWRTVEVRWFFDGVCPEAVVEWFHGGRRVGEPERRSDTYARLARDDLGIKRRGTDLLDIKVRTSELDGAGLPPGLAGRVEGWTKWSFPLQASASFPADWLLVEKLRWTRRYEITAAAAASPIELSQLVPTGCAAELAFLRVGTVEGWSLGFEAFSRHGSALEPMVVGAHALVAETPLGALRFGVETSSAYPAWLRRLN